MIVTEAFVAHSNARLDLGNSSTATRASPQQRTLARLRALPLDTDLAREVQQAFSELPSIDGRSPTCVVRSAVEKMIGPAALPVSTPYYYVERADLEQRIIDCWLSAWSEEVQSYRSTSVQTTRFGWR